MSDAAIINMDTGIAMLNTILNLFVHSTDSYETYSWYFCDVLRFIRVKQLSKDG